MSAICFACLELRRMFIFLLCGKKVRWKYFLPLETSKIAVHVQYSDSTFWLRIRYNFQVYFNTLSSGPHHSLEINAWTVIIKLSCQMMSYNFIRKFWWFLGKIQWKNIQKVSSLNPIQSLRCATDASVHPAVNRYPL